MGQEKKLALITGAGRGIGKVIALQLAKSGADIALTDLNPELEDLKSELNKLGSKCLDFQVDVTDPEAIDKMVSEVVGSQGRIDILVNNAGITQDNLMMRMKAEQWSKVIDVNLNGVFHITRAVLRTMMKAALVGFTKSLAREVGSRGITVNAVAPGFIDTAMTQALNETQQEEILRQIPLKRMGVPEDIAHAVDFLASEKADYITGTVLHVNGGMY